MDIHFNDIKDASYILKNKIKETPTIQAFSLGKILECDLFLKLECLQLTSSFKARGSYVAISQLSEESKTNGVIAMSAGNHAQAVAWHSKKLGIKATIIMPEQAPFSKVSRTRELGAEVILKGRTLNESFDFVQKIAKERNLTLIHPYEDRNVILGQGTIGIEILETIPYIDTLIVPIGGGGLISGISIAAKHINPKIHIYGVESKLYPSTYNKINNTNLECGGDTLADGIAVKDSGKITNKIIQKYVDEILLVDEFSIESAISSLFENERIVSEGAGAAGIAGILENKNLFKNKKVGTVICGGNIDSRLFSGILNRQLSRAGKIARIRIDITDEPGMLAKISGAIALKGGNIIEIYHQRMFHDVPVKKAKIDAVIEALSASHIKEIITSLKKNNFNVTYLSDNSSPD